MAFLFGISMKKFFEVGEIVAVHGVRGEVRVYPWTDSPSSLNSVKTLYFDEEGIKSVKASARDHGRMILCKIEGVNSPEEARKLVGKVLFCAREDIKLPEGGFFLADLPGLDVLDFDTGLSLGTVAEANVMPSGLLYSIKLPSGEIRLVPGVKEFVAEVNPEGGYIKLKPIKGLLYED